MLLLQSTVTMVSHTMLLLQSTMTMVPQSANGVHTGLPHSSLTTVHCDYGFTNSPHTMFDVHGKVQIMHGHSFSTTLLTTIFGFKNYYSLTCSCLNQEDK